MPTDERSVAYTTQRPDVFAMVLMCAIQILDVGCSNGALGRSLKAARTGRMVSGIEFDAQFAVEASQHLDYVVLADLNQLDWSLKFGGRNFDCIIFADVLEHINQPAQCLLQARLQALGIESRKYHVDLLRWNGIESARRHWSARIQV